MLDTATLPKWITAEQLLDYMAVMHPNFQPKKAREFLSETNIDLKQKVKTMSKGMVTQLHLALISAIRSRLLILDEPTIGLDILRRKKFYQRLLEEYFDQNNTVLITSHQVEEIEHILTRVVFIDEGKILLDLPMDELASHFCLLHTSAPVRVDDQEIEPLSQELGISGCRTIFRLKSAESVSRLKAFGQCTVPSLADLFVALQDAKQMNCEDQKISGECHV